MSHPKAIPPRITALPPVGEDRTTAPGADPGASRAAPHDRAAEMAVLGACMYQGEIVDQIRRVLEPGDFYVPAHTTLWNALLELRRHEAPTDPIALTHQLRRMGDLTRVGGAPYLHTLASAAPVGSGAEYYADIVRQQADLRSLQAVALRILQGATAEGAEPEEVRSLLNTSLQEISDRSRRSSGGRLQRYATDGWAFVTDTATETAPIWGEPGKAAWASGESLMLVGPPGVGKSTIAQQVVLSRLGLLAQVLEMPVQAGEKVLYIAADRPARARSRLLPDRPARRRGDPASAFGLLVRPAARFPERRTSSARRAGRRARRGHRGHRQPQGRRRQATTDEAGLAYNNARRQLLRDGVELLELHHQRKQGQDASRNQRPVLDQVYGSAWFTAGAGSVLFLNGAAGDPIVQLHHLKTVNGEIGPLPITHDHPRAPLASRPTSTRSPFCARPQAAASPPASWPSRSPATATPAPPTSPRPGAASKPSPRPGRPTRRAAPEA